MQEFFPIAGGCIGINVHHKGFSLPFHTVGAPRTDINYFQSIAAAQKIMRFPRFIRAPALTLLILEFPAPVMNPAQPLYRSQPHSLLIHGQRGGDHDFTGWRADRQPKVLDPLSHDTHVDVPYLHGLP